MNLDSISSKFVGELEQKVYQLLLAMRKAKLQDDPIYASLQKMEQELGQARRERFDEDHPKYQGY